MVTRTNVPFGLRSFVTFLAKLTSFSLGTNLDAYVIVIRSKEAEATALGVAYLAGLSTGIWKSKDEIQKMYHPDELFLPKLNRENEYNKWKDAIKRAMNWEN